MEVISMMYPEDHTRVPQLCIFVIHKRVPFVGKCSNSEFFSILYVSWKHSEYQIKFFIVYI